MTAVGGSIENVSIAGRLFDVAADADLSMKLGGFINTVEANGNGSARILKTRESLSIEGLRLSNDQARNDHSFLQDVADSTDYVDITVQHADGTVYEGVAMIVGDLVGSSSSATISVSLMGPQKLVKQ